MKREMYVCEVLENGKYHVTFTETDPNCVHESLMKDLIAKKLHKCSYIRSIKDVPNYDGTRNIVVYYDNGFRNTYTVKF